MAVSVQANGRDTRVSVEAALQQAGEELAVALRRLDGSYRTIPVALASPGRVVIAGPRMTIEPLILRLGPGRVTARGTIASEGNELQVEIGENIKVRVLRSGIADVRASEEGKAGIGAFLARSTPPWITTQG